jgi:hypothetical protein
MRRLSGKEARGGDLHRVQGAGGRWEFAMPAASGIAKRAQRGSLLMAAKKKKPNPNGWNYRVMRHVSLRFSDEYFAVHEVFYRKNRVWMWSQEPSHAQGETVEELKRDLAMMALAWDRPVLDYEDAKGKR